MRYFGIIPNDIVNGTGVCLSFWCQGCPEPHCKGCHNKKGLDFDGGSILPDNYLTIINRLITQNNILRNLSILGGEPLCTQNIELTESILKYAKEKHSKIKTFVWTKYKYEDIYYYSVFNYIDVLIDGPFILEKRDITLPLRGSTNQRIINVPESMKHNKVVIIKDSEFFK